MEECPDCNIPMREVSHREIPSSCCGEYTVTLYQCDKCKHIEECQS